MASALVANCAKIRPRNDSCVARKIGGSTSIRYGKRIRNDKPLKAVEDWMTGAFCCGLGGGDPGGVGGGRVREGWGGGGPGGSLDRNTPGGCWPNPKQRKKKKPGATRPQATPRRIDPIEPREPRSQFG